jgi:hypothetical protein
MTRRDWRTGGPDHSQISHSIFIFEKARENRKHHLTRLIYLCSLKELFVFIGLDYVGSKLVPTGNQFVEFN